jgi:hypothetical protein
MRRRLLLSALAAIVALAAAVPAQGAVTIGSPLTNPGAVNTNCAVPCTTFNVALAVPETGGLNSPMNGVVTSFSVRSGSTGNVNLRILRPGVGLSATGVGTSALTPIDVGFTGPIPTSLPIKTGDALGLNNPADHLVLANNGGATQGFFTSPPLADDDTRTASAGAGLETLVRGVVEPDIDCDNKGDESQDVGATAGCTGTVTSAQLTGKKVKLSLACQSKNNDCDSNTINLRSAKKVKGKFIPMGKAFFSISAGNTFELSVNMPKRARQLFKAKAKVKTQATIKAGGNQFIQAFQSKR